MRQYVNPRANALWLPALGLWEGLGKHTNVARRGVTSGKVAGTILKRVDRKARPRNVIDESFLDVLCQFDQWRVPIHSEEAALGLWLVQSLARRRR